MRLGQGFEDVFAQYGSLLSRVANSYEANHALQQELLQEHLSELQLKLLLVEKP